jgi:16S rRNA (cytosine1402-N4)-methyltransferase
MNQSSGRILGASRRIPSPLSLNLIWKSISRPYHLPVMLHECCDSLKIIPGGLYVDGTLGGGGHTFEILQRGGNVIGIDQDSDSLEKIRNDSSFAPYLSNGQLELTHQNFSHMNSIVQKSKLCQRLEYPSVHGVLLDLGVSSHQIDDPTRGFSYQSSKSPLDMRMSQEISFFESQLPSHSSSSLTSELDSSTPVLTAAHLVNNLSIPELANIFYSYGDERRSRQIATEIIATRPHFNSLTLRAAIEKVTRPPDRITTLSRCYQALRIVINREIECLQNILQNLHQIVSPGGRLVVLSYHSLEDRILKRFLQKKKLKKRRGSVLEGGECEREEEEWEEGEEGRGEHDEEVNSLLVRNAHWESVSKGAIRPSLDEVKRNNRARSAKLRVGQRV